MVGLKEAIPVLSTGLSGVLSSPSVANFKKALKTKSSDSLCSSIGFDQNYLGANIHLNGLRLIYDFIDPT